MWLFPTAGVNKGEDRRTRGEQGGGETFRLLLTLVSSTCCKGQCGADSAESGPNQASSQPATTVVVQDNLLISETSSLRCLFWVWIQLAKVGSSPPESGTPAGGCHSFCSGTPWQKQLPFLLCKRGPCCNPGIEGSPAETDLLCVHRLAAT
ncbi:hypothetical protein N657DRAFT_330636 [Parathielavia appendiculata]|uniref:Uncharacterized protein n=1 Tax=Parathielavia appendiculata TaxID=2587402 RepID=A0AAN6U2G7_9PEZI|nr:hypothetical protein N657DRAFT_330636 [Parathielavia appendiculata]